MSGVLKQILDSKKTVMERFKKLYRILYIQFINADTMHKKDLQSIIQQLNTRIDTLEANTNAAATALHAAIGIAILGHVHPSPQAPAGTLVTLPGTPTGPVPLPPPSVTGPSGAKAVAESKAEPELVARMSSLAGQGPATAPHSDGFDPAVVNANVTGLRDILVGEGPGL